MGTEIDVREVWPFLAPGARKELLGKKFKSLVGITLHEENGPFMKDGRGVTDAEVLALVFGELSGDTRERFRQLFARRDLVPQTDAPMTAETSGHPPSDEVIFPNFASVLVTLPQGTQPFVTDDTGHGAPGS